MKVIFLGLVAAFLGMATAQGLGIYFAEKHHPRHCEIRHWVPRPPMDLKQ